MLVVYICVRVCITLCKLMLVAQKAFRRRAPPYVGLYLNKKLLSYVITEDPLGTYCKNCN